MGFNNRTFTICCLSFVVMISALVSCGKDNPVSEEPDTGEVSPAEFFQGNPGRNRIELYWKVSDTDLEQAVIRWNNNSDSLAIPIEDAADTMRVIIDDLQEGMTLPGIVTNITQFGCFVDIGIKENGLVHISELANRFVSNVSEVVSLHQHVKVKVLSVNRERKRIQLSMKGL